MSTTNICFMENWRNLPQNYHQIHLNKSSVSPADLLVIRLCVFTGFIY